MDKIKKIKNNSNIISIFFYKEIATNVEAVIKNKHFFEECGYDGRIRQYQNFFKKYYYIELFPTSSKNFIKLYENLLTS